MIFTDSVRFIVRFTYSIIYLALLGCSLTRNAVFKGRYFLLRGILSLDGPNNNN
jgi:hypothetical protein